MKYLKEIFTLFMFSLIIRMFINGHFDIFFMNIIYLLPYLLNVEIMNHPENISIFSQKFNFWEESYFLKSDNNSNINSINSGDDLPVSQHDKTKFDFVKSKAADRTKNDLWEFFIVNKDIISLNYQEYINIQKNFADELSKDNNINNAFNYIPVEIRSKFIDYMNNKYKGTAFSFLTEKDFENPRKDDKYKNNIISWLSNVKK